MNTPTTVFCHFARSLDVFGGSFYTFARSFNSFVQCISVRSDGTEDNEIIHCLKSGGVAEDAASLIVQQTAALQAREDVDDNCDPFADIEEDDSELETNEVAVDDKD